MFELKTLAVIAAGCFSGFLFRGTPFAVTLERTFDGDVPVIQNGVWRCKRDFYHAGGYPTFEIIVPDHTLVKFHKGNLERHSKACVLVGEQFAMFEWQPGIAQSGAGFDEFMRLAAGVSEFDLTVSGR
jgi:hypothetical protein